MNGPGHFAEAERLLLVAGEGSGAQSSAIRMEALAHATLAAAAATIDAAAHPNQSQVDYLGEWWRVQEVIPS